MQRNGIIYAGRDSLAKEGCSGFVPFLEANRIKRMRGLSLRTGLREHNPFVLAEQIIIDLRLPAPLLELAWKVLQLHSQNRRLKGVETPVDPGFLRNIGFDLCVIEEHADPL